VHELNDLNDDWLYLLLRLYEMNEQRSDPFSEVHTGDFTLLHWAAQQGKRGVAEYCLSLPGGEQLLITRDRHGHLPHHYARNHHEVFWQILHERSPPSLRVLEEDHHKRPAVSLLPEGVQQTLRQIEHHGYGSVRFKGGFTLLHWAAANGNAELCDYLIHVRAFPDAQDSKGRTPISLARTENQFKALDVLEASLGREDEKISHHHFRRHSISSAGRKSVGRKSGLVLSQNAIPAAYQRVIEQIDEHGWDKMQWKRGFTLLHWAAKNDRADLVAHFLHCRADPNQRDESHLSAFDYAKEPAYMHTITQTL
jgi:ankyrin repeat protein